MNTQEIVDLIHTEARLLDSMKLDEWLSLYTDDATYWVPINENADPQVDSSVIFDNRYRLAMRVEQLARQNRLAQAPQSQTVRMVSNISVTEVTDSTVHARYVLLVMETRSGDWRQRGLGEMSTFPAHCDMECVLVNDAWRIRRKKIVLIHRHQPLQGLSFIL